MEIVDNVSKKTEIMAINGEHGGMNSESIITYGNQKINDAMEFKYLGVNIVPSNPTAMVEHRITSAPSNFAEMNDVFTNHRINIKTRGKFMNAFIRTPLTYNCNTLFNAISSIKNLKLNGTITYDALSNMAKN